MSAPPYAVHITLSGDVFLKSRRTQKVLIQRFRNNLDEALNAVGFDQPLMRVGSHRFEILPTESQRGAVIDAAKTVFGVASVDLVHEVVFDGLDDLAEKVAEVSAERVEGSTFAVRAKRSGTHEWRSPDLARRAGALLVEAGGSVDLSHPDEVVSVTVLNDRAFLVTDHQIGAGGLPLGSQDAVLCLLSGGFDSVVAAWMLMSRGCPVDFVHFTLNCAQSDHALAVGSELWQRWGHGTAPQVHLVEFQPVKDALLEHVDPRMRQVTLKVLMAQAAGIIAEDEGLPALITGDSMGQVSSQTLPHLVAVTKATSTPIFRPLLGLPKQAIIDLARDVGTAELSARAQEVCDLSEGRPVATSADESLISRSVQRVPDMIMTDAVATRKSFLLADWTPGQF
jgi:thiamine biosynthesis protein ThiI